MKEKKVQQHQEVIIIRSKKETKMPQSYSRVKAKQTNKQIKCFKQQKYAYDAP